MALIEVVWVIGVRPRASRPLSLLLFSPLVTARAFIAIFVVVFAVRPLSLLVALTQRVNLVLNELEPGIYLLIHCNQLNPGSNSSYNPDCLNPPNPHTI
jgi:hypothetical protein